MDNIIISKKIKRIIAILIILFTLLSQISPIFAASGTGSWVGGQYASGLVTTDSYNGGSGVLIRKLINYSTGEAITVFCAEHGTEFKTDRVYSGEYNTPPTEDLKNACKVAYFGWYGKHGDYLVNGGMMTSEWLWLQKDYVFTQQYIWEIQGQSNAVFVDDDVQSEYEDFKATINSQMAQMKRRPSFDGQKITIQLGEEKVLEDSNGVLSDYNTIDTTLQGVRIRHTQGENILRLNATADAPESIVLTDNDFKNIGMIKAESADYDTSIYFSFDSGVQAQLYTLHYNDPVTMSLRLGVEKFGKLELSKLDTNNTLIDGAVFNVTGPDGFNQNVTVANGKITLENLKKGTYSIREVNTPNGYLKDTNTYTVEVEANQTATKAIINNEPTGKIVLYKVSTNNDKIKGAKFKIYANEKITNKSGSLTYYTNGAEVATITTNSNGVAEIDNLPMGKYIVKEVEAPEGYLLNENTFNANLEYVDENTPVVEISIEGIKDKEPTGKIILHKVSENNDKIKGAVFTITANGNITNKAGTKTYYTNGQVVANIATNQNGIAEIDNLPLGKYLVKEKEAPEGYLLNENTFNANLVYKNDTTPVVEIEIEAIKDKEPTGKIVLNKISENNDKIEGAIFKITAEEKITNKAGTKIYYTKDEEVARITTNENGIAEIGNLPLGRYKIKEIQAPHGYLLNEETFEANLVYKDDTTPVITIEIEGIVDKEPRGVIGIIKKDSKTGSIAQGDATLKDAVYKVYADEDIYNVAGTKKWYSKGDLVATRTTNEIGECEDIEELPLGKYIIKEEVAPIGYLLDTNVYSANLEYKDQYTKIIVDNTQSTDKVKEMKVHIFKSGIKVNSGETPGLQGSIFTIKLKSAVDKALDEGYSYEEIWDGIDEYGNKVEVDIARVREAQTICPTYETIETDEDGNAYTTNYLPYGTYIVKETTTPKDYETASDFTFTIKDDESEITDIAKKVKHIVVNNEQLESYIKLIKKDLKTEKIVTLSNATFQIKATKDIYDRATGKILYKKGETVKQKIGSTTFDSFTTNARNLVVPTNSYNNTFDRLGTVVTPLKLEVGSYEITEIKLPDGFLKLDEPITFKVEGIRNYDKDQDGDFIKEIVIYNEQPTGTLLLNKKVAIHENVDTSLIDLTDLSKISFSLTAKEDIIDYSDGGTIYKKGEEIGLYNLDENGSLVIEDLPMGIYELKEISTLDGLILDDNSYEIKFVKEDDEKKVYTSELEITNETTLFEFSKTDITGDSEIEGATITVFDKDEKIIDTWISSEKTHKIEGLKVGETYTLREVIAPDEYVKASDISFKVESTKEVQKVTMIDKIVDMSKVDIAGEEIEGAKIQVFSKDKEIIDEWESSKEPHKIKNLVEGETYTLHEELAIDNFVKASDIEFTVSFEKETQHIEMIDKLLQVTKTDFVTGEEIEGASLKVIDIETEEKIDEWESTKEAHFVKGLEENKKYKLVEITAPYGYEIAEEIEFEVTNDKETQVVEMKDMPILKNIKIVKIDSETEEIIKENFKFGIYEDQELNSLINEMNSDKDNGFVEFKDLRFGTYYIKEIEAPKGYHLSDKVIKVEINDKGIFIDGELKTEENNTCVFNFSNEKIPEIQTGDEVNYSLIIGIIIISIIVIAIGIIILKRKND